MILIMGNEMYSSMNILMKYLLIPLIFFNFNRFSQTEFFIPMNEDIKFKILKTAPESSIGGVLSSKFILKIKDENDYILTINSRKGIEFLAHVSLKRKIEMKKLNSRRFPQI